MQALVWTPIAKCNITQSRIIWAIVLCIALNCYNDNFVLHTQIKHIIYWGKGNCATAWGCIYIYMCYPQTSPCANLQPEVVTGIIYIYIYTQSSQMYSHPHRNVPMYVSTHLHSYIDIYSYIHLLNAHIQACLSVNKVSACFTCAHDPLFPLQLWTKQLIFNFSCTEEYISTMATFHCNGLIRYNVTRKMVLPLLAIWFHSDTRRAHRRVSTSTLNVPLPSIILKSHDLKQILDHY